MSIIEKIVIAFITLLLILPVALECVGVTYGSGSTIGYVYTVDEGILWNKVRVKTSMQSSESDCYLLSKKSNLDFDEFTGKKLSIKYDRHLVTLISCPEGTGTNNEIISFSLID